MLCLPAWCAWRRSRFFGNTAPLIVFLILLAMSILFPQNGASAILFATLPFLLLFVAGVFADLIESRLQAPALAFLFAVIAAQAAYSIVSLMRMYLAPSGFLSQSDAPASPLPLRLRWESRPGAIIGAA